MDIKHKFCFQMYRLLCKENPNLALDCDTLDCDTLGDTLDCDTFCPLTNLEKIPNQKQIIFIE